LYITISTVNGFTELTLSETNNGLHQEKLTGFRKSYS